MKLNSSSVDEPVVTVERVSESVGETGMEYVRADTIRPTLEELLAEQKETLSAMTELQVRLAKECAELRKANQQLFDLGQRNYDDAERYRSLSPAIRRVIAERRRQIEVEGWTPEHDDEHIDGAMTVAAACYALADRKSLQVQDVNLDRLWQWTGWATAWFKPKDVDRNLERAAALIVADMERLDRAVAGVPAGRCAR
jgi:hypothetical protein